ncbi:hypothetical protein ASF49_08210 [Methylobacterium sp. Leaf104]|uniref:hypothetical protein n=1 Tax=Methylobacterium TaxID=407 RepID=UPI0006FC390A|nr:MULTISPECIES: hypothetical protein [Methylobacterium]KQP33841.1 hypothetical protein ASF49_08210 [Methylobacterium sp. Leaf104]MCI9879590.1 hypothetical protein [Methylobacterium goesingense]
MARTKEEARALREAVLDRWASGMAMAEIASECGITRPYVGVILNGARARLDRRAGYRYAVHGLVRLSPAPAPVRPAQALTPPAPPRPGGRPDPARREAILDAWASGLDAPTIAAPLGMRWRSVIMVVVRARAKGDRRAHRRQPDAANGLTDAYRRTLDRLDRLYGVRAVLQEDARVAA